MINGAHAIIYSKAPEEDRAFLRDIFGLPHVDVGGGWLIFGLPPSEVAVHPSSENQVHELYFLCEDVEAFVAAMGKRNVPCGEIANQGWGLVTRVTLPGGGNLGVYQPRHARPASAVPGAKKGAAKKPAAKKPVEKKPVAEKPAAKKPAAKPAAKKPAAKPAAKKPVAKPAAKKPVAKPATKKPASKKR